jgi:plasmid stabilization system protein ParE
MGETRAVKLRFTLPALDDLEAILGHIDRGSPAGAKKVKRRIQ